MARPLNAREEKFCQLYTADIKRNGAQAAIGAGYSPKSARVQASRMLTRDNVRRRCRELEREAAHAAADNPDELRKYVYRQLISLATSDITDVIKIVLPDDPEYFDAIDQQTEDNDGQRSIPFGDPLLYVCPSDSMPPEVSAAIKSVRRTREGLQVEMHPKDPSLRILAEATGITGGGDLTVNLSFGEKLIAARKRVEGERNGSDD